MINFNHKTFFLICMCTVLVAVWTTNALAYSDDDNDGIIYSYDNCPEAPNPGQQDADNDGLTNLQEYNNGTDPTNADTDGDGMSDQYELDNGFDPLTQDCPDWYCGGGSKLWLYKLIKDRL